jgi:hypothetical protein
MTPRWRKKSRVGRPSVPLREAREFGTLVEQEMAENPDDKRTRIFDRIRRRDPRRWGSVRKMFRLWKMYREEKEQNQPAVTNAMRDNERMRRQAVVDEDKFYCPTSVLMATPWIQRLLRGEKPPSVQFKLIDPGSLQINGSK